MLLVFAVREGEELMASLFCAPCQTHHQPMTKAPVMPAWLKITFLLAGVLDAVLFGLAFAPSNRGYGGMGGIGDAFVYLIGGLLLGAAVVWSLLSWGLYRAMHDLSRILRSVITGVFLFLPVLFSVAQEVMEWSRGNVGALEGAPAALEPVTFAGVVFPPGSTPLYEQNGRFGKDLVGVRSSEPVTWGGLELLDLRLTNPPNTTNFQLELSSAQSIDGWLCKVGRADVARAGDVSKLVSCRLAAQQVGNSAWPSGTYIFRTGDSWTLDAASPMDPSFPGGCSQPIMIGNVPHSNVMATVDATRQQVTVEHATPCLRPGS